MAVSHTLLRATVMLRLGLLIAAALLAVTAAPAARAQDFFIPGQGTGGGGGGGGTARAPGKATPRPRPQQQPSPAVSAPVAPSPPPGPGPGDEADASGGADIQFQLPPAPDLPALNKGATPPAAVIGVMGVPDVMRASSAAQQVEKIIGERRQKLNEDAQKEQATWQAMQQALVNERGKLSADQVRARERELQERIVASQRQFRERNRTIQLAGQYALRQIERTLVATIKQVSESRGMNLVLHRAQVALNVNEFDITQQVTEQMNRVLPSVVIPPDGVAPPVLSASAAAGGAAPAQTTGGTAGAPK